jgi:rsbT co-antagonist protein RsbR
VQDIDVSVAEFLDHHRDEIVDAWRRRSFFDGRSVGDCQTVLNGLAEAVLAGAPEDPTAAGFDAVRGLLGEIAADRLRRGETAAETTVTLHDLKPPVVELWTGTRDGSDPLSGALRLSTAMDTLRLVTMESIGGESVDLIEERQQLLELSTPVVRLWDGIVAVPLIGTLDSARTQATMEGLLQAIVDQQARVAILDITGVSTVDTAVAQHLLRTVMAARLMGATCVISGIRPQIAQTMVQLGIDLGDVITRATLADALGYGLRQIGLVVTATDNR